MNPVVEAPSATTISRGSAVQIMFPHSVVPGGMLTGTADGEPDATGRVMVTLRDGTRRLVTINETIVS
jgi:hypothetical protein